MRDAIWRKKIELNNISSDSIYIDIYIYLYSCISVAYTYILLQLLVFWMQLRSRCKHKYNVLVLNGSMSGRVFICDYGSPTKWGATEIARAYCMVDWLLELYVLTTYKVI